MNELTNNNMGSYLSRGQAEVEEVDISPNSTFRYPPKSGDCDCNAGFFTYFELGTIIQSIHVISLIFIIIM